MRFGRGSSLEINSLAVDVRVRITATSSRPAMNVSKTDFQRKIGLLSGICFVVGTIIGSGIFISPKGVFVNANCTYEGATLVWIACGLYSMLGALIYSELGTTMVRSGGDYAYIKTGFGSFVSFLFLWLNLVVIRPASQAILALTFAYYLLDTLLDKSQCLTWDYETLARLIAGLLISLLGLINCINVKWAIHLQNAFTVLKTLALFVVILVGIGTYAADSLRDWGSSSHRQRQSTNWIEASNESPLESGQCESRYSLSIYSGLFAFGGWNYLNIVTDELKDPYKNLPRASLFGIFFSTLIYVLANVAYFVTLTPAEILNSPAIALTFARKLLGPLGVLFISLSISASAVGSLNATIFTSSRLFCMGAEEGHLPSVVGMIHCTRCTPIPSLVLSVLLSFVVLFVNDIYTLIDYFSFSQWLFTGVTVASGVYLRYKKPEWERPIKLPISVLYIFILLCLLLTILASENILNTAIGIGLLFSGVAIYQTKQIIEAKLTQLPKFVLFNSFMQKTFLIVERMDALEKE